MKVLLIRTKVMYQMIDNFYGKNRERIVGLDILRTIAILLVVYYHGQYLLPVDYREGYFKYIIDIDGVSVFFVLSGFLIGGILLRTISNTEFTRKDLINFWIRRWFRTVPNYMFVLLLVFAYHILIFKNTGDFSIRYFLFLQNFSIPHPTFFAEAWSLCVEEWFYLLFPITSYFFFKVLKNKPRSILYSALIFLLIPMVLRIVKYQMKIGVNNFDEEFRKVVILRLDSLMYGVIAAYIHSYQKAFWSKYKYIFLFLGISLIVLMKLNFFNWTNFYGPLYFNIESISVLLLMPFFSELRTTKIKYLDVVFVFISIISYSMYLLNYTPIQGHLLVITNIVIGRNGLPVEKTFVLNSILYWFYTIVGSWLLYYFYERRMTHLRDKIKL